MIIVVCKQSENVLYLLLDELDVDQASRVRVHMQGCAECRQWFEFNTRLFDLAAQTPEPVLSETQWQRMDANLADRIEQRRALPWSERVAQWLFPFGRSMQHSAVLAVLAVLVFIPVSFDLSHRDQPQNRSASIEEQWLAQMDALPQYRGVEDLSHRSTSSRPVVAPERSEIEHYLDNDLALGSIGAGAWFDDLVTR